MYYRGAQAAIVVYDITNQESFTKAKSWVRELQRQANANIVIALSGNKADLANKRVVEFEVRHFLLTFIYVYTIRIFRKLKRMPMIMAYFSWRPPLRLR